MTAVRIDAPATTANLGPGFDTLGMALDIVNTVHVVFADDPTVVLAEVTGDSSHPLDPHRNLLCEAYREWERDTGVSLPGATFRVENRIPVARGLGASAAATVAGLAAAAHAAEDKNPMERIVRIASTMEGHADNAVAAALGGVTAAFMEDGHVHAVNVANHLSLGIALFVPDAPLLTTQARAVLPDRVSTRDALYNIGRVAYLTTALIWGQWESIGPAMCDRLHQPYRAALLPSLGDVMAAAREAGAYGAALSGGGPTVIALGPGDRAEEIAGAMQKCAQDRQWRGVGRVTRIRHRGVQVSPITPVGASPT